MRIATGSDFIAPVLGASAGGDREPYRRVVRIRYGAYIPNASVELDSGTRKYQARTDDAGIYRFSNLPAGEYTLTFRVPDSTSRSS